MSREQSARWLAEKLREARVTSGLSQSAIAERLHKPQSYVSRCESGARRIDIFDLMEFARVYQKPLMFFIPRQEIREIQYANQNADKLS